MSTEALLTRATLEKFVRKRLAARFPHAFAENDEGIRVIPAPLPTKPDDWTVIGIEDRPEEILDGAHTLINQMRALLGISEESIPAGLS